MMLPRLQILPLLASILAVTACVSVDPAREQAGVMDEVAARLGVLPAAVRPEAGEVLDEAAAVGLALGNNHTLMARLAEAGIARADWAERSRPLNPVVEAVSLPGHGDGRVWDVDLRTSLLGLAATPWRAEAARQRYEGQRADTVLATIDFIADTRRAWVAAIAARQRLDLQERIRDAATASLVVAEEMRAAGNTPVIELERERVFARQAELDLLDSRHAAVQARLALVRQLGVDLPEDSLPTRLPTFDPARDLALDAAEAMVASLPLQAAASRVEASAGEAGLENWASLLEHAEIGAVWEREEAEWSRGWTVEFALPVFDTGDARRTAARLRAGQAVDRHAALVHEIRTAIRAAQAATDLAASRIDQLETDALPATERLMDATMRQYNAMQVSVFDLMAAVQMRTRTGQAYVDALKDLHEARISLQQIRAGGSPVMIDAADPGGAATGRTGGGH
ncbi:hypothetical protein AWH62_15840 [Maricaulis sp. W15]|uniref:TolC family protein n=1 Tax=Maricaulis sp. W15 TaxID=1772333 RepID=UPI00094913BD|nr:TolC family protein [Maricaulis sp. W15]OLF78304.1 hypothetical protein AWH62_15840 [Maricaulis sp. W15]